MKINEVQAMVERYKGFMKLHKYNPSRVSPTWWVQRKFDGVFCAAKQCEGQWEFFSRTGKPLYLPEDIRRALAVSLPTYYNELTFIGELICPAYTLEELSGLVNPNRKLGWRAEDLQHMQEEAQVVWHDSLALRSGVDALPYAERYKRLGLHATPVIQNIVYIQNDLDLFFDDVTEKHGWEGLVLKDPSAPYVMGKRSHAQLKRVRQYTEDLECVGVLMGQGKRKGMIGALVFRSLDGSGTFNADLGTGWTDEKRKLLTEQWEAGLLQHVLGLWEVQGLQPSSTGKAIRLPKAIRRRYDKD